MKPTQVAKNENYRKSARTGQSGMRIIPHKEENWSKTSKFSSPVWMLISATICRGYEKKV